MKEQENLKPIEIDYFYDAMEYFRYTLKLNCFAEKSWTLHEQRWDNHFTNVSTMTSKEAAILWTNEPNASESRQTSLSLQAKELKFSKQ